jgi:hypothetical protein
MPYNIRKNTRCCNGISFDGARAAWKTTLQTILLLFGVCSLPRVRVYQTLGSNSGRYTDTASDHISVLLFFLKKWAKMITNCNINNILIFQYRIRNIEVVFCPNIVRSVSMGRDIMLSDMKQK